MNSDSKTIRCLRKALRIFLRVIIVLLLIVVILPALLYIPAVQDFAVKFASEKVSRSTGMNISIGQLRLRFPLDLSLRDVTVIEATGDTLATLSTAELGVEVMPLFHGEARLRQVDIDNVSYRMGTPDSVICLRANVNRFTIAGGSSYDFKRRLINITDARLNGGKLNLLLKDTVTPTPVDTTPPMALRIQARALMLENIDFEMRMMPLIDTLRAVVPLAVLRDGDVDLGSQLIKARSLSVDSVSASYLTPLLSDGGMTATAADSVTTADSSSLWKIYADSVRLTATHALYGVSGARPLPGLDMNYLEVSDVSIAVDSFYNCGQDITVPLRQLRATERCGLTLSASGLFKMADSIMTARNFELFTQRSNLMFDAEMGLGDLTSETFSAPLSLQARGDLSLHDAALAVPAITPIVNALPSGPGVALVADITGTSRRVSVNKVLFDLPRVAMLSASGAVDNPFLPDLIAGKIDLNGAIRDVNSLKPALLDAKLAKQVNIPPITLSGNIIYSPGLASGSLKALTSGGALALNGSWKARNEGYSGALQLREFPVDMFMPSLGVGKITASAKVDGHGFNFVSPKTEVIADVDLDHATYLGETYTNIVLHADLTNGTASGMIASNNRNLDFDTDFTATISKSGYDWSLDGDLIHVDLQALKLSESPLSGAMSITSNGTASADFSKIDGEVTLTRVDFLIGTSPLMADSIALTLNTDSSTLVTLRSQGIDMIATSPDPLMKILDSTAPLTQLIDTVMASHQLDVVRLQQSLPRFSMAFNAVTPNLITRFISPDGMALKNFNVRFSNDSLIHLAAAARGINTGSMMLDSIDFHLNQKGKYLLFDGALNQRPGTLDNFAHVKINGFVGFDKLSVLLRQSNIKNEQGYLIGVNLTSADSVINAHFVPGKPMIAYKRWAINSDNYITLDLKRHHISADLALTGDNSYLKLYTLNETADNDQEDVVVEISNIQLQDWLSISPFAPPIKGDIGADMRFHLTPDAITGKGDLSIDNLYYGRDRVGDFGLGLDLSTNVAGAVTADLSLMVDSVEVITATGALNDTTRHNPFMLDLKMISFPLAVANPFLPKEYARLSGRLNGSMDVTGSMTAPVLDGYLQFDSAAVSVGMLGTKFSFSDSKVSVDSNLVIFDDFAITAVNSNPLTVNGTVDARSFTDLKIDLGMKAHNMQIVGSSRPRGADVYGKAFIDLDASLKGSMQFMMVNADLSLLAPSNVTYIMTSGPAALTSQASNMVEFVVFSDSTAVAKADSIAPALNFMLDANLTVEQGTTINVDLSTDGKNKVTIEGNGSLNYEMTPMNDGRLTGRFNINSGFARYTPPFMSEKLFNFEEGSYVAFNGNMLNPVLNIHAYDRMKANVTQSGHDSRLVNFNVLLSVTNTLENMNVAFDLTTNDDLTVQNELTSMSPDQRANQAMNLLLYNVYTGVGTKGNANIGNPLYSFLTSQLNSWAAQNIKGVDISFGVDQYDKTTNGSTSSTTSYSYKVSKSLFNDRVKIIVGGNYSTDADADENFSQNLINDISFEYLLNRSGSMYVRVFRHVGFESILEGEITQTGAGFVMKRKLTTLRNLFNFLPSRSSDPLPAKTPSGPSPAKSDSTALKPATLPTTHDQDR